MWGHGKKTAIYTLGRQISPEINHAGILILDFQDTELWLNVFLLLSHEVYEILWYDSQSKLRW